MKPIWWIRLHNPGSLLWWPGYLAWKWFRLCRAGHPIKRVADDSECSRFWQAEADYLDIRRDPNFWNNAGLTAPPLTCLAESATRGDNTTTIVSENNSTSNPDTLICLCGRH